MADLPVDGHRGDPGREGIDGREHGRCHRQSKEIHGFLQLTWSTSSLLLSAGSSLTEVREGACRGRISRSATVRSYCRPGLIVPFFARHAPRVVAGSPPGSSTSSNTEE